MNEKKEIQDPFGDPVKHEARLKLWLPELKQLKSSLGGRYLKYFTLPGPKAYDVVKWKNEGLIEYTGRGYSNVCFCDNNAENFANATQILKGTPGVYAGFEQMIRGRGNYKYDPFWNLFPFDVYNLDFCGTCFEDREPLSKTFVSIIDLINAHISRRGSGRFSLLLTIRIDEGKTNKDVIVDLRHNLQSNSQNSQFTAIISRLIGPDINRFISNRFCDFILISIPKLIAFSVIPQTKKLSAKIEDLHRAYYPRSSSSGERYHIGKFVFSIAKEVKTLKRDPAWYRQIVSKSLDLRNIQKLDLTTVSQRTKDDLSRLKQEIKQIEDYG